MLRCLILLALALSAAAEATYTTHQIPNSTLTVSAPDDWTAARNLGGAALILRSPVGEQASDEEKARAQASLVVAIEAIEKATTAEKYAAHCKETLERLFPSFAVLDEGAESLNGRDWWRVHYQFRTGQTLWDQQLFVAINPKSAWCVTYSCAQEAAARWQETFATLSQRLGR